MKEWLDARGFWEMGGALAALAVFLLAVLAVSLRREQRHLLRRPVGIFVLYLAMFGIAQVVPRRGENTEWVRVVAFACALIVVSRSALLFATETSLGRWLLPPLPKIFQDVVQGALLALVGLLTLHAAGVDPGQLLTTSALLTAVVGLALQDTLGNLFSGLALQVGRPFEVGDWIDIDADPHRHGRVIEIGWRATKVVTLDEVEVIVPNGIIAKATIRNYTRPSSLERRQIPFAAAYGVPPGRVLEVVEAALAGVPEVTPTPRATAVVESFGDSAVQYVLRYYTNDHRAAVVTDSEVRQRIWHALSRASIPIPFPQRDVRLFTQDEVRAAGERTAALAARREVLGGVDLFRSLDPVVLSELAAETESFGYAAMEDVVRQGTSGDTLYVVQSGEVEVVIDGLQVATLGTGAFFGEMSLLTGERRSATVRTTRETQVLGVGHTALRHLFERHPELYEHLSAVLAERQVVREVQDAGADVSQEMVAARSSVLLSRIRSFFAS